MTTSEMVQSESPAARGPLDAALVGFVLLVLLAVALGATGIL